MKKELRDINGMIQRLREMRGMRNERNEMNFITQF